MKILIVDDSAFMRTILKDLIPQSKWAGATILEAGDGEQAVALCQSERPDLMLLDIVMPGKDGIAVLKEIGFSSQSVVIVSSMGQDNVIDQAKALGAKDYIVKPFDAKQVIDSLNKLYPEGAPAAGSAPAAAAASATPMTDPAPAAAPTAAPMPAAPATDDSQVASTPAGDSATDSTTPPTTPAPTA